MGFNLDTWRAAHPTWSVTVDGYTYRGRPVSARAVAEVVPQLSAGDTATHFRLMAHLFRLAFPWRISYLWRGDPVRKLMALPPGEFREVRDDFFAHLAVTSSPPSGLATSGTPSLT